MAMNPVRLRLTVKHEAYNLIGVEEDATVQCS
jgi:hypothetical protein